MVCLAYKRSQGKMAVWAAGALAFPAARATPWAVPGYLQRRRRCRLGILLPASGLPSRALSVQPAERAPAPSKEIQSSEEALIHHTSPAACHLNAKYFHCIFKAKQEKK